MSFAMSLMDTQLDQTFLKSATKIRFIIDLMEKNPFERTQQERVRELQTKPLSPLLATCGIF